MVRKMSKINISILVKPEPTEKKEGNSVLNNLFKL